ncbi:phosphodiester glycosidase family protein [Pirellulaceae bacterium SH449]
MQISYLISPDLHRMTGVWLNFQQLVISLLVVVWITSVHRDCLGNDDPTDSVVAERREIVSEALSYEHRERSQPRPLHIHILKLNLQKQDLEWRVVLGKDPDGDGPAEAELTSPFQLAKQTDHVLAVVNTNPWSEMPTESGKTAEKAIWYPGRPVDISGLAVSRGLVRSEPQKGYVSIWRGKSGRHEMNNAVDNVESVEEGFGGFQQIVRDGERIVQNDSSLHPRTGVGFDPQKESMFFVVVDGRQPGYSEGMTTVELAEFFLEIGCWDAANLDGGGSSIMALSDAGSSKLVTANRPSDRLPGGITMTRPLPIAVVLRAKEKSEQESPNR